MVEGSCREGDEQRIMEMEERQEADIAGKGTQGSDDEDTKHTDEEGAKQNPEKEYKTIKSAYERLLNLNKKKQENHRVASKLCSIGLSIYEFGQSMKQRLSDPVSANSQVPNLAKRMQRSNGWPQALTLSLHGATKVDSSREICDHDSKEQTQNPIDCSREKSGDDEMAGDPSIFITSGKKGRYATTSSVPHGDSGSPSRATQEGWQSG
ncbi:unnamed protein product [Urochloa humidicola]